ncbi:hypothetical protein ACJJTC_000958 [Scirpophaga incertulas]
MNNIFMPLPRCTITNKVLCFQCVARTERYILYSGYDYKHATHAYALLVWTYIYLRNVAYCKPYNDSYLCWGPATPGQVLYKHCPPVRFSNPLRLATRKCGVSGFWSDRRGNESSFGGWTNYTSCFEPEVNSLFKKVSDENASIKFDIAQNTRYLEIVGFGVSLLALLLSLLVYSTFRTLLNNRTKIHKNLFCAMVIQVLVRLVVYIDQELVNYQTIRNNDTTTGLQNVPYLCECIHIVLEYSMTSMFMWMFLEGFYLNKLVSGQAMNRNISYSVYLITGWGYPFLITLAWAVVNGIKYSDDVVNKCWYGYNFKSYYWIVQGPRVAVMGTNFLFLMNILRVVFIKLRRSQDSDVVKAKKALRAALVLLPLLGLTNILNIIQGPLEGHPWKFALWSYTTHFLRSFEGFFIALLYCFLNTEVQLVIRKYIDNLRAIHETRRQRRRRRQRNTRRRQHNISTNEPSSSSHSRTKSEGTQTKAAYRPLYRLPIRYTNLPYSSTRISMPSILITDCPHQDFKSKDDTSCEDCHAKGIKERKCVGTDTASPLLKLRRISVSPTSHPHRCCSSIAIENELDKREVVASYSYPLDRSSINRSISSFKSDSEIWNIRHQETRL